MTPKPKKIASKTTTSAANTITQDFKEAYRLALKSYQDQVGYNPRLKLIDIFCVFLVVIAGIQTLFMGLIRDTFPFNAFLAGFIVCVGQFVLLVSLRLQLQEPFEGVPKNRAFGEFVIASLILHFTTLHFIN
ncbi:OST2 (YOR103C) [Zygosaccharomyces parabailii]|uniref:Dolichyl-diphosphooligosaccharide--protein glycosyltransferase subunit OST2 n=1 Tax=Zygosaccharomyces bailii (strain CLIB 213 / ATCC 58445 / CBS 680 / BCRC 21525 / NBRC 1098 / NCYC 1416 / NRRL Y-2227) TaxID=1333698 RepID=A0A8J2TB54_ZYGB2|nr:OST2 (YOR103C) [Zygosaccharomyces parabailii]CDF91539.1 ZYBA0S12-01200g1_1 [Zygosaccharomyces bailii CLIB 213]CDH11096.1 probable Dolichyl-diphosphooligosaccharide--protein glycosyltransferase subunit OST2 [Zygosaccharomyces bailii ISA1307]